MRHRPSTLLFAALMVAGFVYQLVVALDCCATTGLQALQATTLEQVLFKSGGALTTMNLHTDWWRILTSMFVHAGVIHLLANLLALLQIGDMLESLFGTPVVILSFVAGGIVAGLATMALTDQAIGVVYVGASGGIFGLAGALLAASRRIWVAERSRWSRRLSSRLIGCVAFNLVLGIAASAAAAWAGLGFEIANTAHVGGLVTGLLIGLLPIPMLRNERTAMIVRWFDPPPPPALPPSMTGPETL
jgi:rhomboid protease GluP